MNLQEKVTYFYQTISDAIGDLDKRTKVNTSAIRALAAATDHTGMVDLLIRHDAPSEPDGDGGESRVVPFEPPTDD